MLRDNVNNGVAAGGERDVVHVVFGIKFVNYFVPLDVWSDSILFIILGNPQQIFLTVW